MPDRRLLLKVGMPLVMVKDMVAHLGLARGARLILRKFMTHVMEVETEMGNRTLLPRIRFSSTPGDLGVDFERLQFPVKAAFAMPIENSRGITLRKVGLYLPTPVYTHGQLYTALSRVGAASHVRVISIYIYIISLNLSFEFFKM